MKLLRIQPAAIDDAAAAAEWYEAQRPGLGAEFILQLDAAIERATERPDVYELQYRSLRRVLMRRFPARSIFCWRATSSKLSQSSTSIAIRPNGSP